MADKKTESQRSVGAVAYGQTLKQETQERIESKRGHRRKYGFGKKKKS